MPMMPRVPKKPVRRPNEPRFGINPPGKKPGKNPVGPTEQIQKLQQQRMKAGPVKPVKGPRQVVGLPVKPNPVTRKRTDATIMPVKSKPPIRRTGR